MVRLKHDVSYAVLGDGIRLPVEPCCRAESAVRLAACQQPRMNTKQSLRQSQQCYSSPDRRDDT